MVKFWLSFLLVCCAILGFSLIYLLKIFPIFIVAAAIFLLFAFVYFIYLFNLFFDQTNPRWVESSLKILAFLFIFVFVISRYIILSNPGWLNHSNNGSLPSVVTKSSAVPSSPTITTDASYSPDITNLISQLRNDCGSSLMSTSGTYSPVICGNYIENISIYIFTHIDKDGKIFTSAVKILPIGRQWVKQSVNKIEDRLNPDGLDVGILTDEFSSKWANQDIFSKAKDIITVGAASYEGDPVDEKSRAFERARQILRAIIPTISNQKSKNLYLLNLGKYKEEVCGSHSDSELATGYQRPIMVVSVLERPNNADISYLENALKDEFQKLPFNLRPMCYTDFELTSPL